MAPLATRSRLRAFHLGGYWRGPNDMVRQMMLGLRSAGVEVCEYDTDEHPQALDTEGRPYDRGTYGPVWLRWEVLGAELEAFDPHLVICNAGGLSFRPADAERLRQRCCLLGIALSDPDVFAPATSRIAPHFDLILTMDSTLVPAYEALGCRAGVLPMATNEEFYHPVPPRPEHACDVLILGRAHPDRVEPVSALVDRFHVHLYGEGWEEHGLDSRGLIFGDDVLAALSSAGLTVVFFRTACGGTLVKVSLFDFTAAGALVATNYFADVEPYFDYDVEVIGFASTADLLAKVDYYLRHPDAARRIRRAGRERVLRDHTWRRVWPRILAMLSARDG